MRNFDCDSYSRKNVESRCIDRDSDFMEQQKFYRRHSFAMSEKRSQRDRRKNGLTIFMILIWIYRWYFRKIKRIEAEKKLLLPENDHGAFLIRDSESRHNDYSLSGNVIRWWNYQSRSYSNTDSTISNRWITNAVEIAVTLNCH